MKKVFFIAGLLTSFGFANAQKVDEANVPAAVKTEFKSLYPDVAAVKWENEDGNYEANFKKGTMEMSALIDPSGKLKETEEQIAISSLPKAASDYIAKNLPGKKVKEASKIKDGTGKVTYEAEIDETDYVFDSNGNFLKKEKDND